MRSRLMAKKINSLLRSKRCVQHMDKRKREILKLQKQETKKPMESST